MNSTARGTGSHAAIRGCDPRCLVPSGRRLRHQPLDRCTARCCCTQGRYWDAIALADRLDEIVTDDRVGYCDAQLSAEDRVEIVGLIMALVSPLHIPVLFEETLRGAWDTQNWVPPSCITAA